MNASTPVPPRRPTAGIDWASDDHAVAVVDPDGVAIKRCTFQPGAGVLVRAALNGDTVGVHDGDGMVFTGPVKARGGSTRSGGCAGIHGVLLAVGAAGQHPPVVRDTTAGRSLIGARWRAALSPVRMSWATGPRRTHAGPHTVKRTWRWPGGDQGCTGDQADTGLTTLPDTATSRKRVAQ